MSEEQEWREWTLCKSSTCLWPIQKRFNSWEVNGRRVTPYTKNPTRNNILDFQYGGRANFGPAVAIISGPLGLIFSPPRGTSVRPGKNQSPSHCWCLDLILMSVSALGTRETEILARVFTLTSMATDARGSSYWKFKLISGLSTEWVVRGLVLPNWCACIMPIGSEWFRAK